MRRVEDIRRSVAHWPPRWSTIAIGAMVREKAEVPSIIIPPLRKGQKPKEEKKSQKERGRGSELLLLLPARPPPSLLPGSPFDGAGP